MKNSFVSPFDLERADQWNPNLFCGPAASLLFLESGVFLRELATGIIEGLRQNEGSVAEKLVLPELSATIYRPLNLGRIRIYPDRSHFAPPLVEGKWCVKPGDVVVNKIPPLRAAWVTAAQYRHPVDSNCLIIRGLQPYWGFWLALCLNQGSFTSYLIQSSGASVLPRVSISALRDLKIREAPPEADELSAKVWDCADEISTTDERLVRLLEEVEEYIRGFGVFSDSSSSDDAHGLTPGHRFPAADVEDSWVPEHVELSHVQFALEREAGWVPLSSLVTFGRHDRARLDEAESSARYLRLKDVGWDLMVGEPEPETEAQRMSRVFKEPLSVGDVLLSTLVTSPRAAYVDEEPHSAIYVTDHWERLRFRETPGAWALVLSTRVVHEQLERSAMGAVQQFTNAQSINRLRLPGENLISWELRSRWEQSLVRHHRRKRQLEAQWLELMTQSQQLFEREYPSRQGTSRTDSLAADTQQGRI